MPSRFCERELGWHSFYQAIHNLAHLVVAANQDSSNCYVPEGVLVESSLHWTTLLAYSVDTYFSVISVVAGKDWPYQPGTTNSLLFSIWYHLIAHSFFVIPSCPHPFLGSCIIKKLNISFFQVISSGILPPLSAPFLASILHSTLTIFFR